MIGMVFVKWMAALGRWGRRHWFGNGRVDPTPSTHGDPAGPPLTDGAAPNALRPDMITFHYHREPDGTWWGESAHPEFNWTGQPAPNTLEKLREIAREAASLFFTDWKHLDRGSHVYFLHRVGGCWPADEPRAEERFTYWSDYE